MELSEKSGKDSTRTLSLVIHTVRFKEDLQIIQGVVKLRKP
jgi:hypothetical protein